MTLRITGSSTALFATWYFVEELGLLLDCGDGVSAALLQKARKVKHVLISHADRDHLTGLFQFNQLNARDGLPVIHYPKDCGSFPALAEFARRFDPHVAGAIWDARDGSTPFRLAEDILVQPIRNGHVREAADQVKSLSYKVDRVKRKLRPELAHLSGPEIERIGRERGKEATTMEVLTNILGYSGDTPVEDMGRWDGTDILIHEATFLRHEADPRVEGRGNLHSTLEEVMAMVAGIRIGTLVLGHFSSRYDNARIDQRIRELCDQYRLQVPVHRLLPGQVHTNILSEQPINS